MKQFDELRDSDEEENNSNVVVENEELFSSSSGNEINKTPSQTKHHPITTLQHLNKIQKEVKRALTRV
jgi:hypothetical protein